MASILKVDELRGIASAGDITITSEGGAATQSLQQGVAKSWLVFDATSTLSVTDSLNSSSVTDRGVGEFTQNFASSWSAVAYVLTGGGTSANNYLTALDNHFSPTTALTGLETRTGGSTSADSPYSMFTFHGDLA